MIAKYSHGFPIIMTFCFFMIMVGCGSMEAQKEATGASAATESQIKSTVSISETQSVTLKWDDVPGATSYNIYWSHKPGVTRKNGTKISNAQNPHKIAELKKGKKYYFVVTAVNASGESKVSEEFSITVGQ
jgi:fibronectin type 3 domain-containing protein